MPFYVNIHQFKVNSMSSNASINIGPVNHNSHSAHTKWLGSNMSAGDHAPVDGFIINQYVDPDTADQSSIGNTENPYTNQG
ncbi:spore germination protein [Bacillus tianshenii]|nr:spore germination protein [Bacillus tianshenii]